MTDGAMLAGSLTMVTGLLAWLIKAVIEEYQRRLDRHDQFMDRLVEKNSETLRQVTAGQVQASAVLERVAESVNHNNEIARNCEEVVSAQMRRRISAGKVNAAEEAKP